MGTLNLHKVELESNSPKGFQLNKIEDLIQKSEATSAAFWQFNKEIGVNTDSALLLVTIKDGPFLPLKILSSLDKDIMSELLPVYLKEASSPEEGLLYNGSMSNIKNKDGLPIKQQSLGFSAFYDLQNGIDLVNASASLIAANERKQVSLSFKFGKGRLINLQTSLDRYANEAIIDLGFVQDQTEDLFENRNFISYFKNASSAREETKRVLGLVRRILNDPNGEYRYPFRFTEIIRAFILGQISVSDNVPYLTFLKSLDNLYPIFKEVDERLAEKSAAGNKTRNKITSALIEQLVDQHIIKIVTNISQKILTKGTEWNNFLNFVEPYIEYFEDNRYHLK